MFIAAKFQEINPPPAREILMIADNIYSHSQLLKCETKVLTEL